MKYNFYYDESEHSREIGLPTITASNYYDNFLSIIVGWSSGCETIIEKKYADFESKYSERKKKGELKSDTFKGKQFLYGFASFNRDNVELLTDFLSIIDENFFVFLSTISKLEFIILQLFKNYHSDCIYNMDALKYSVVKSILTYRPSDVIESIYGEPSKFVDALKAFFKDRVYQNKQNPKLKKRENEAFEIIINILETIEPFDTLEWNYSISFEGFSQRLHELGICDYSLTIDKEGVEKTLSAAIETGLKNVSELDSTSNFGIRFADMLIGVVGKMMKALYSALHCQENNDTVTKNLLDISWFKLNDKQLHLYKMLYRIISESDNAWYIYSGNYSDDVISFMALLQFMGQFESVEQINENLEMQPEYCNTHMCQYLEEYHHQRYANTSTIGKVSSEANGFYLNQRGAEVYFDIEKQPVLPLKKGENRYYVLSVGNVQNGVPVVTVESETGNLCYRLPLELKSWVMDVVGAAVLGYNLFPSEVVFTKHNEKYYVNIL